MVRGEHVYLAIDLKSFYASVECHDRGLDPLRTHLVVADEERTDKTICLAVSPSLKGVWHSRTRTFVRGSAALGIGERRAGDAGSRRTAVR